MRCLRAPKLLAWSRHVRIDSSRIGSRQAHQAVKRDPVKSAKTANYKRRHLLDRSIVQGDLDATLEGHRNVNQSRLIRKVRGGEDPAVFRPNVVKESVDRHPAKEPRTTAIRKTEGDNVIEGLQRNSPAALERERVRLQRDRYTVAYKTALNEAGFRLPTKRPREFSHKRLRQERERLIREKRPEASYVGEETWQKQMQTIMSARSVLHHTASRPLRHWILDYRGDQIPIDRRKTSMAGNEPWAPSAESGKMTGQQLLDRELTAFNDWMEPNEAEMEARAKVSALVVDIVKEHAPAIAIEKYGSQVSGLALPTSDLDFRIFHPELNRPIDKTLDAVNNKDKLDAIEEAMSSIAAALKNREEFEVYSQHGSRFALVPCYHKPSGLEIQLVAAPPTQDALVLQRQYLAKFPHLKTLFTVAKSLIDIRGLNKPWEGGLSSYTTFMMLVASLHLHRSPAVSEDGPETTQRIKQKESVGKQLLDFLHLYGNELDMWNYGIIAKNGKLFQKMARPLSFESASEEDISDAQSIEDPAIRHLSRRYRFTDYLLALQDPANPMNDLGRQTLAIKHIRTTFWLLRHELLDMIERADQVFKGKTGVESMPGSMLRPLVGRCDHVYDLKRAQLELYGDGIEGGEALGAAADGTRTVRNVYH